MSDLGQALVDAAKTAALTQAKVMVARGKQNFMETFGGFLRTDDLVRVQDLWSRCVQAKEAEFLATTAEEAQEQSEIYDACLDAIEEIGTGFEIVGKAKAGVFVRSMMHEAIAGTFAVLGAVLQAGLSIAIPGVGSLIGAGLNAGLQHVVAHYNQGA